MREIGNSTAKPLPPWICTALSAAAQATRAPSSLAMPASTSERSPASFLRAADSISSREASILVAISASLNWMPWCLAIGLPKASRSWA